jgi:hypothetical protein
MGEGMKWIIRAVATVAAIGLIQGIWDQPTFDPGTSYIAMVAIAAALVWVWRATRTKTEIALKREEDKNEHHPHF